MSTGWVKLHRVLMEHPTANDDAHLGLFIRILLAVSHKRKRLLDGTAIPPGSLTFTQRNIIDKLYRPDLDGDGPDSLVEGGAPSRNTVLKRLKTLEGLGVLRITSGRRFSTMTVVNWSKYQSGDDREITTAQDDDATPHNDHASAPNSAPNFGAHIGAHIGAHVGALNKNVKNVKKPLGAGTTSYTPNGNGNPPTKGKPSSLADVEGFADEIRDDDAYRFANRQTAAAFFEYFESIGWRRNRTPMKDWRAAFRGWCRREAERNPKQPETDIGRRPRTVTWLDELD